MISRQYTVNITSEHADGRYGTTHQWMWIGGAPETSIPAHLYRQHLTEACYRYGRATAVDGGMGCVSIDLDSGTSPATFATPHRETLTPEQIARYMPNPEPKAAVVDVIHAIAEYTGDDGKAWQIGLSLDGRMFNNPDEMRAIAVLHARKALVTALALNPGIDVQPLAIAVTTHTDRPENHQ